MDRGGRYLVPVAGAVAVAGLAALLIVQVVWRPWSDIDRSWRTHLNLSEAVPPGYSRSPAAYVGGEGGLMAAWQPDPATATLGPEGRRLYVARGCASCHGLDAQGGLFGRPLAGLAVREVVEEVRAPSGRMPPYSARDLDDRELEQIAAYLRSLGSLGDRTPERGAETAALSDRQ